MLTKKWLSPMARRSLVRGVPFVAACVSALGVSVAAQLASRPVSEWRAVLDAPERIAALRIDEVVPRLKLAPDAVVADLGAGTGPFVVPLAMAVRSGVVYAVEVDPGFLPLIEGRARAAGVTNVRTVLGAFIDPKLPSANLDLAFMHDVLHHIANRPGYLKALAAYLKPDARIAVIDYQPSRSPHQDQAAMLVSKEQAQSLLAEIGFAPLEDIALFDDKWFVIYGRAGK